MNEIKHFFDVNTVKANIVSSNKNVIRVFPVGVALFAQRGNMTLMRFMKTVFRRVKLKQMALNMLLITGISLFPSLLCHPEVLSQRTSGLKGDFKVVFVSCNY